MCKESMTVPDHIAIILDGNGRWAKAHGVPRKLGHKAGCENLEQVVEDAARLGVKYLTIYGFSTENWKRSEDEVGALMRLLRYYLKRLLKVSMANNVKVKMIGERSRFDGDIIDGIRTLETDTQDNKGMVFVIAINYGSRDEIARGMQRMTQDAADGKLRPEEVTEKVIAGYLDTAGMPDPDLMIRTSGEQRLSNYLLWQMAYAELYFTDVYWPDFHKEDLIQAIEVYNDRNRRFGGR